MSLVWILTWLPLALPAVDELPKPINVTLRSTGSGYILSWDPAPGTPPGTSYSVSVQTDRRDQFPIGCQQVQNPCTCNLTEAFKDPSVKYDIKVTAKLGTQRSQSAEIQYKPIDHLDLPELTVVSCQSNLCVDLQPPKHQPPWIYKDLGYKLQISSGGASKFKAFRSLETQVLTDLQAGRQHCISVQFSDSLENKISNFSQPVCVSTPARFSADEIILFTLITLVLLGLVGLGLWFWTYSPCLKIRLPPILMNIPHLEEVLVQASPSSLMIVRLVAPPAGTKRSSQSSSDDSDEDSETSCRSSSRGGVYTERVGTNLHSSSSSSSSSSSLSSEQKAETTSCSKTPDGSSLQPQALTETWPRTEPEFLSSEGLTRGRSEEEQQEVGGSAGLGVNLHTLTFGRLEEDEEEEEDFVCPSEESSVPLVPLDPPVPVALPPQTAASSWTVGDVDATDETCVYMGRPPADVLQNLLSKT